MKYRSSPNSNFPGPFLKKLPLIHDGMCPWIVLGMGSGVSFAELTRGAMVSSPLAFGHRCQLGTSGGNHTHTRSHNTQSKSDKKTFRHMHINHWVKVWWCREPFIGFGILNKVDCGCAPLNREHSLCAVSCFFPLPTRNHNINFFFNRDQDTSGLKEPLIFSAAGHIAQCSSSLEGHALWKAPDPTPGLSHIR